MAQHTAIAGPLRSLVALILIGIATGSGFPASVVQAQGVDAEFLCQHPTDSGTIDWTINGTTLRNIDTSTGLIRSEGRGGVTEALVITAIPEYNNTVIVCLRFIRTNETVILERSPPAILIIQGAFDAVLPLIGSSTSSAITLTWEKPVSLNLTTAEPDIVYCLDIYDIKTDTGPGEATRYRAHLISDCTIFEKTYTYKPDNPDPTKLFHFVVIPRNNVEGAKNGTANSIDMHFSYELPKRVQLSDVDILVNLEDNIAVNIVLNYVQEISGPRTPENYSVSVNLINTENPEETSISNCLDIDQRSNTDNVTISLNCDVQLQQLCTFNISASNEAGNALIFENGKLSTHYIQDIFISHSTPGQIGVSCEFLVNDVLVPGFLAVIHSTEESDNVHYLVTQNSNETNTQGSLSNLRQGTYTVILYTIGNDGLPLRRAAGFPQNVSVTQEENVEREEVKPEDNIRSSIIFDSTSCILHVECSFDDNTTVTSTCVVVYWQHITNPYDLINLNVEKIDRHQSEKSNTIQTSINLQNTEKNIGYHISVFLFNSYKKRIDGQPLIKSYGICGQDQQLSTNLKLSYILVPVTSVILLMTITIIITANIVAIIIKRRISKKSSKRLIIKPVRGARESIITLV